MNMSDGVTQKIIMLEEYLDHLGYETDYYPKNQAFVTRLRRLDKSTIVGCEINVTRIKDMKIEYLKKYIVRTLNERIRSDL